MLKPKDQILARMYVVLTLFSILPALVAFRVVSIHLKDGKELRQQGEQQARSFEEIEALRGSILDASGRTLASNSARYTLSIDPTMSDFRSNEQDFYRKMESLTGRPASYFRSKVQNRKSRQYVRLLSSISEAQSEVIQSWGLDAVILEPKFSRTYNYGKSLAHVLGYVSADNRGIAGLELQYNDALEGTPGRIALKRDRTGEIQAVAGGKLVRPIQGENLILTIDLVHQSILEEELARGVAESGARWGTAVAMNPKTGAILGIANVPTYDPNRPAAYSDFARRNHAITDRIEPGSTFKLISAVAALEEKVIQLSDSIETNKGFAVVSGAQIRDTHGYGTISFGEAIAKSSNIAFAKMSEKLDSGKLYQYARNLGFGQPTWLDLPGEVGGSLKRPADWSRTTRSRLSIGYEVEVTAIQLAAAYAAMANGGLLVQPFVVAARQDMMGNTTWVAKQDSVRRAFKKSTARKLEPALELVVSEGTAKEAGVDGVRIAGKTGTANKVVNGSYQIGTTRASFAGYFPVDDPKVVMVVIMDEPEASEYGGAVAAPVFRRVAERWINTMPGLYRVASELNQTEGEEESQPSLVPDVKGQPVPIALARLNASGIPTERMAAYRNSAFVVDQKPEPGPLDGDAAKVRLETVEYDDNTELMMPDLTGLSVREAANWLMSQGIDVTVKGHGSIVSHTPGEGMPLTGKVTIRAVR